MWSRSTSGSGLRRPRLDQFRKRAVAALGAVRRAVVAEDLQQALLDQRLARVLRRKRGDQQPLRGDARLVVRRGSDFAQTECCVVWPLERNHRPENIDQDIVHAFLADQPARRAQRRAGERGVRFPERIAHAEHDSREGLIVARLQRREQFANMRNEMSQRGQAPLGPVERTQPGELPLAARQQGVVERRACLPPDFPQLPQPVARLGREAGRAFAGQETGDTEEMRQPCGGTEPQQPFPRDALRHEPHRDLIGMKAERLGQGLEQRLLVIRK